MKLVVGRWLVVAEGLLWKGYECRIWSCNAHTQPATCVKNSCTVHFTGIAHESWWLEVHFVWKQLTDNFHYSFCAVAITQAELLADDSSLIMIKQTVICVWEGLSYKLPLKLSGCHVKYSLSDVYNRFILSKKCSQFTCGLCESLGTLSIWTSAVFFPVVSLSLF